MIRKVIEFIKKETVFVAAVVLAVISAFFVPPGAGYLAYIDWQALGIFLALMLIVAGIQRNGLFDAVGRMLLKHTKNTAQLTGVLVFLCFFSSMFITNDVALLTFVPFALVTLQKCGQHRLIVLVFLLQTIAANLGSMLTPIGNPQNLYLYSRSGMGFWEFVQLMYPYTAVSGLLLLIVVFVLSARKRKIEIEVCAADAPSSAVSTCKNAVYLALFVLSLLAVAQIIPSYLVVPVVAAAVFFCDRRAFLQVDYYLLLTFVGFFIFTGNMTHIPAVGEVLHGFVTGRELVTGIAASQIMSNVPAAMLLSGFTGDYHALVLGINFGGLGTLIASMASLISYRIYAKNYNRTKGIYLIWFTVTNLLFLAVLVMVYILRGR